MLLKEDGEIISDSSLDSILSSNEEEYEECHNLPFNERTMRGSQVHLPRKENTWSHHQRLFEENVGKTKKVGLQTLRIRRFGSFFYTRGRY